MAPALLPGKRRTARLQDPARDHDPELWRPSRWRRPAAPLAAQDVQRQECTPILSTVRGALQAFARMSAKCPSRMCQSGFQYTPVASMATCEHPALASNDQFEETLSCRRKTTDLWRNLCRPLSPPCGRPVTRTAGPAKKSSRPSY